MELRLVDIAEEVCRFGSDNKHVLLLTTQDGKPLTVISVKADLENGVVNINIKGKEDES